MSVVSNGALARLRSGGLAIGFGVYHLRGPAVATMAAACGYDWLILDSEHGPLTTQDAAALCVAGLAAGVTPVVRCSHRSLDEATRALDNGAQGVIVPMVENAAQAAEIVQALRYPPVGSRSWGGGGALFGFRPPPIPDAIAEAEAETLVIAMIETREGLANAAAIAAVTGIDMLFVGAQDLSVALGRPGDVAAPEVLEAFSLVADAAQASGKLLGMGGIYDEELAPRFIAMGARFVAGGSDHAFLMAAASQRSALLRRLVKGPAGDRPAIRG